MNKALLYFAGGWTLAAIVFGAIALLSGLEFPAPPVAQQVQDNTLVVEDPATGFSCIQYPPEGPTRGKIVIRF